LILIPWLIQAPLATRSEGTDTVGVLAVAGLDELTEIAGVAEFPDTASGFESSFFHITHLDIEIGFSKPLSRLVWNCDSEEST